MSASTGEAQLPAIIAGKLLEHCASNLTEANNYITGLVTAETNLIRVNTVYEDLKRYNLLPKLERDAKDDSLGIFYRQQGNWFFRTGDYLQALIMYTRSIATSKTPVIRSLAYANRSACLMELNRHEECIVDIDRALLNNFPTEFQPDILKRRQLAAKLWTPREEYHEEVPKIPQSQKNPLIQCASNCVKIEFNEEYGRHVVATKDIEIGELIAVERPFACVVIGERLIHCHHCMELCYNPIPCSSCTRTLFCSEACKNQAQIYHKYECLIQLDLANGAINFMKIIVRAALLAKPEYEQLETYYFNKDDYYRSDRFKEIYCLKPKLPRTTEIDRQFFTSVVITAIIFHWLESTDFFENDKTKDHFKVVLLSLIHIYTLNGMMAAQYIRHSVHNAYLGYYHFAETIYSFTSLFNHSCCPNIFKYYYGATVVLRAVNTIKKGEQCFIDYGYDYLNNTKDERQLNLSQKYLFTCKCKACEFDWKGYIISYGILMGYPLCQYTFNMNMAKLSGADVEFAKEMLPVFIKRLKLGEHTEPWGDALSLKEFVKHCYKTMGNKRRL